MWAAKALTTPEFDDSEGMMGTILGGGTKFFFAAHPYLMLVILSVGFVQSWWFGVVMVVVSWLLSRVMFFILPSQKYVAYYLAILVKHLDNHAASLLARRKLGSAMLCGRRIEMLSGLQQMYQGKQVLPPSTTLIAEMPPGDTQWLLINHEISK
jgi:hypothetical protein